MSHGCKRNAIAALALGLFLQLSGCLNPRPEELPSGSASNDVPGVPVREACDSNPLPAGCGLPESDMNGAPVSAGDLSDDADAPGAPAPGYAPEDLSGSDGDGGAGAGDDADAGSLGDASDAGAP